MRVVSVIIIVLVIAVVGMSYRFGMDTEYVYNDLIDQYTEGDAFSVVSRSYDRGILSSKARTVFAVRNMGKEIVRLDETDTIYHGPIPVLAIFKGKAGPAPVLSVLDSRIKLAPAEGSGNAELFEKIPPIDAHTVISFKNKATADMSMPGFELDLEDGDKLSWKGFTGRVDYDTNEFHSLSDLESPGLQIDGKDSTLTVTEIKAWSELSHPAPDAEYPTGDVNFTVGKLDFLAKPGAKLRNLTITGIDFKGKNSERGGLLDSSHSMVFDELTFGGDKYGPGGYELSISNIDSRSWKKLQALINANQNAADSEEAKARFTGELVNLLPGFVSKSPKIELRKLSLETSGGKLEGHLGIYADGEGLENVDLAQNPVLMLAALTADAGITVSKELFVSALTDYKKEEVLENMKAMGEDPPTDEELAELASGAAEDEINLLVSGDILVEKDDSYTIEAAYKSGQVIINGQPIDLGALLQ
ncbi:MAG TPA: YdgA family protein [Thermodesulfobacteriota bacterium]|nr:YdgA family protein [Thermodesulfobacteriota bacterium]